MVAENTVVAVTGASGYIGSRLLRELEEENLGKLVAIDTRPPPVPIHNIAVYRRDVNTSISDLLRQHRVTTLVHLAFSQRRSRNRREARDTSEENEQALRSVLDSCVRSGVRHFIYLSSHTVYGSRPDNPIALTEQAPLRPVPEFSFGYDKFSAEQVLGGFTDEHQDTRVTILRCCSVLGPGANRDVSRIFLEPRPIRVWGYNTPFQFLHEDDVARVLTNIIHRRIDGVFNLAGEGVAFFQEVSEMLPGRILSLPKFLAYPLVKVTRGIGLQRSITTAELDLIRYPTLLSTAKLGMATGYRARYTAVEAVTSFVNSVLI